MASKKSYVTLIPALGSCLSSLFLAPFLFPGVPQFLILHSLSLWLQARPRAMSDTHSCCSGLAFFFPGLSAILSALADKHHPFYSWTQ